MPFWCFGTRCTERWSIRRVLGCVNPASWLPLAAGCEFTQPRAHLIAHLCSLCDFQRKGSNSGMTFNWQFFYQNYCPTTSNARRMFAWQHKLLHKLHLGGFSFFCHFQPLCSVPPSASWMHCAVIPCRLVTVFCKNLETSF